MVQYKKGNLLAADDVQIICHQVNTLGVMGAGIAKSIASAYPDCLEEYKRFCKNTPSSELLGQVYFYEGRDKAIANIFGQKTIGRNGLHTNYYALRAGLASVCEYAKKTNNSVGIPYKIGCGLAGGDWNIVSQMIEEIFDGDNVTCYVYSLT